jgi:secreted PhoX family phosphatase
MPDQTGRPAALPVLPGHKTARSAMTCRYRCGDACSHDAPNRTLNPYFGDVVQQALSRGGALKGAAVLALATSAGAAIAAPAAAAPAALDGHGFGGRLPRGLDFTSVAPNTADAVTIPEGYSQQVVIRWGDPVLPGAPRFDARKQSAKSDAAAKTFRWKLLLVCGDPEDASTYFAGFPKDKVSPISCPDNVAFDDYGNLWIATDGNAVGSNDGLFAVPVNIAPTSSSS